MTIEELLEQVNVGNHLVKMSANWCQPCRMYDPILDEVANEVNVIKVDIEEYPNIAQHFGIRSIPFSIFYKDGNEIHKQVGIIQKEDILSKY